MKQNIAAGLLTSAFLLLGHNAYAASNLLEEQAVSNKDKFIQACMADVTLNLFADMSHGQPQHYQSATVTNSSKQANREQCSYSWSIGDKSGKYVPSRLDQVINGANIETPLPAGPIAYVYLKDQEAKDRCPPGTVAGEVILTKAANDKMIPWVKDGVITKEPYTVKGVPTSVRFVCPNVPDLAQN
jgi:hypothetical protein